MHPSSYWRHEYTPRAGSPSYPRSLAAGPAFDLPSTVITVGCPILAQFARAVRRCRRREPNPPSPQTISSPTPHRRHPEGPRFHQRAEGSRLHFPRVRHTSIPNVAPRVPHFSPPLGESRVPHPYRRAFLRRQNEDFAGFPDTTTTTEGAPSSRSSQGWEPRTHNAALHSSESRSAPPILSHKSRKDGAPSAGIMSANRKTTEGWGTRERPVCPRISQSGACMGRRNLSRFDTLAHARRVFP